MKTMLADNRVRRIAVLAGVNVVLAIGGWLAIVGPQRHNASTAQQRVQSVKSQLQQIAAVTTPVAPKQPVIHTADVYVLSHAMPVTEDEPDMLLAIDQVARAAGVKLTTVSPQTPVQAVGYTTLPITLWVNGSYAQITSFMAQLRLLDSVKHHELYASGRLFSVQAAAIAPAGTASGATSTTPTSGLEAQLTVDAYVFGQVAGATPLPVTTSTSTTSTGTSTTSTTTTSG